MDQTLPSPPAAVDDPDLTGRQLGDYRLLRRLGRGGMAEVYLAEQASLGRKVAVKVLRSTLAGDASYVRRFLHEAQAAASLVHGNIVQIHEVGCIDGVHFIAQEYVEGLNLKQLLARQGALNAAATVRVIRGVAGALQKAGAAKITHRDIKPENIMLARSGDVKVADFGLARVEQHGQSLNLTQVGVTMGTPLYMSPEQVEGRPVDTRSDIYSLGVTCFHVLAGQPPFNGDTPLNIAVQHLHTEPPRLEDLRSDLPGGLCRIVHKMMQKRPEQRYQHAGELLQDLRALNLEGSDADETADELPWPASEWPTGSNAVTEATRQLAAVMRCESAGPGRGRLLLGCVVLLLTGLLLGGLAAWLRRPAPLLAVAPNELPAIERKETARDQFFHAAQIGSREAWQSVARYFPPQAGEQNRYYALRAEQRLAELDLQGDNLTAAAVRYGRLASAETGDDEFRAIGTAGLATVHLLRGETSEAQKQLAALGLLMDRLPEEVRQLIIAEIDPRLRPELMRLARDLRAGP
jgi:serine/threonine-protein kinase